MAVEKFVAIVSGMLRELKATTQSNGTVDAGNFVKLSFDGKVDKSVLPGNPLRRVMYFVLAGSLVVGDQKNVQAFPFTGSVSEIRLTSPVALTDGVTVSIKRCSKTDFETNNNPTWDRVALVKILPGMKVQDTSLTDIVNPVLFKGDYVRACIEYMPSAVDAITVDLVVDEA